MIGTFINSNILNLITMIVPVQIMLFQEIKRKTPKGQNYIKDIAAYLNLSEGNIYKLESGEIELKASYLLKLLKKYKIEIKSFLNLDSSNVFFKSYLLEQDGIDEYLKVINHLCSDLSNYPITKNTLWKTSSDGIPLFHVINFPDLSYFNMYLRYRSNRGNDVDFETYVNTIPKAKVRESHRSLFEIFKSVDTVEIISQQGILNFRDTIINVWKEGGFKDSDTVKKLLNMLVSMIHQIKNWCVEGTKDNQGKYMLYFSNFETGLNSLLSLNDGKPEFVMIKSFEKKVLLSEDESMKNLAADEYASMEKRKICMCGLGDEERDKKINKLINEILHSISLL